MSRGLYSCWLLMSLVALVVIQPTMLGRHWNQPQDDDALAAADPERSTETELRAGPVESSHVLWTRTSQRHGFTPKIQVNRPPLVAEHPLPIAAATITVFLVRRTLRAASLMSDFARHERTGVALS